ATHTVEAAEHGKHIYVEKPFAETMEDNRRARAAVEKAGVVFQVGSQRRSAPNYHAANDYIRSGQFGDIVMCEMTWNVNQPGRWRRPSLVPRQGRRPRLDSLPVQPPVQRSTRANTSNIGCSGPIRQNPRPVDGAPDRRGTGSPD
ncbi:MAG: Gfo/Idh/MocA family protein, partial [Alistipes sp.]